MTIIKFRKCTQAQYDALQPPRNPAILYFISDRGWFYLGDIKYYSGTSETGLYLKLDANNKINLAYLYDSILGQMEYVGTFDPALGYPELTTALNPNREPRKGDYFISTGTGTVGGTEFNNKDWLIKTTDGWQHIDNTDAVASVNGKMGVVVLDGTDIQLGGGVNTTIQAKFIAVDTLLDDKVDKVEGKALSTNDYTDEEKTKLTGIEALAEVNIVEGVKVDNVLLTPDVDRIVNVDLSGKVDKVEGKALSTNDYTDDDMNYVDDIREGVEAVPKIVLPLNRLVYCDINNNYTYINPARLETMSKIAYFKVKNGRFKCKYTNSSGRKWTFPTGTVLYDTSTPILTSTNETVDVTITQTSGYVILYSNNWIGSYNLDFTGSNCITGALADLPALTYYLNLANCSSITGDLSDLPALTYYLNLTDCSSITGDLSDLPALTNYLSLYNCSLITGDLSDLPALTNYLNLYNCSSITGAYVSVSGNSVPTTTILTGTGMSATDMDNTLIAYAATTKDNGTFTATNKNRTAASDDAVATLVSRGWSINGLIKI